MRRSGARLGLLSLLLPPLACSTLADPEPATVCVSDDECDSGEICGAGTCYASNLPGRSEVALDLTAASAKGSFRLDIYGPDHAVERIDTRPTRYRVSLDNDGEITGMRDELRLSVMETFRFGDEVDEIPVSAKLTPTQSSRLGITTPKAVPLPFDPFDENDLLLDPLPALVLPWAHYDSNDKSPAYTSPAPEPERPLLVAINPDDGIDPESKIDVQRGIVWRQLVREQQALAGTHAFALQTDRDCHRKLHGSALVVGEGTPPPVGISVELVHARRSPPDGPVCDPEPATGTPSVCSPQTLARVSDYQPIPCTAKSQCPQLLGCYPIGDGDDGDRACGCESDAECPTGQVCALESHRCALDLASPELGTGGIGLTATEGGVATTVEKPEFEAWVYTYCEDDLQGDREMEFVVRATPTSSGGDTPPPLPPLSFHTSVDFIWQNGERPRAELKNMCFPAWAPPQPLTFDVSHAPQEIYRASETAKPFVCCSPACLDLGKAAPTPPTSCRLAATLTARTIFTPDPDLWSAFSCMALDSPDASVPAGSQRVTYSFDRSKCPEAACDIALSPGADSLEYELRIEPPPGSLIRSMTVPAHVIDPTTTSLTLPKLEYRVLLRGSVSVDPDECPPKPSDDSPAIDCPRASILVERLRVPDEEPALAPIFLTTSTIAGSSGAFVLPVNPGVYLVTALPASGSPGGPADIRVVDLRLDSKLVDTSGPIPIAELGTPLALDIGRLVTFELEGFGRSSTAIPLDVGYWAKTKPAFNGVPLNLNDPATCYGSLNRGCQIRRLRLGGSLLSLTQESYIKYLARGVVADAE